MCGRQAGSAFGSGAGRASQRQRGPWKWRGGLRGHRSESAFSPFSASVGLEARGLGPSGERGTWKGNREFGGGHPGGSRGARRAARQVARTGRLPRAPSGPAQGQQDGVDLPSFDTGSPNPLGSVHPPGGCVCRGGPPGAPGSRGGCNSSPSSSPPARAGSARPLGLDWRSVTLQQA